MKLFIVGHQGSGKTGLAYKLKTALNMPVVDAWNGIDTLPNHCIVTTQREPSDIYQFDDAIFMAPVTWKKVGVSA